MLNIFFADSIRSFKPEIISAEREINLRFTTLYLFLNSSTLKSDHTPRKTATVGYVCHSDHVSSILQLPLFLLAQGGFYHE